MVELTTSDSTKEETSPSTSDASTQTFIDLMAVQAGMKFVSTSLQYIVYGYI
jgi:hypothetical protein